jgi:hypothetical protein
VLATAHGLTMRAHEYVSLTASAVLLAFCFWRLGGRNWCSAFWCGWSALIAFLLPIAIDLLLILWGMGSI